VPAKKGSKKSEETRAKMRVAQARRWANPEARAKVAAQKRGHEVTAETRAKISAAKMGQKPTAAHLQALRDASKRLWESPEYRAKVCAGLNTAAVRARVCAPEVVARRNAAHRAYWAALPLEQRKRRTKAWSLAGAIAGKPSTIELAVQAALTTLGVEHIAHKVLGPFVADIYIPHCRLVIECDGDYWHSLPKQQARDRRRDGWMRYHGYRVARLPESLIRRDALAAVKTVLPDG
jgi:hypothetical protein